MTFKVDNVTLASDTDLFTTGETMQVSTEYGTFPPYSLLIWYGNANMSAEKRNRKAVKLKDVIEKSEAQGLKILRIKAITADGPVVIYEV